MPPKKLPQTAIHKEQKITYISYEIKRLVAEKRRARIIC
jgi:hypothetical protein